MIELVRTNEGSFVTTKEYRGYGQILKISDDGFEKIISVEPEDTVYGVYIEHLAFGKPYFRCNSIPVDRTDIMLSNLEEAKKFCEEFSRTRETLLQ